MFLMTVCLLGILSASGAYAQAVSDPGLPSGCTADPNCDDGLFCNGAEVCAPSGTCRFGTPPDCNDGVGCTADGCSESLDSCVHTPVNVVCNDGNACNGIERCDEIADCVPGPDLTCEDGNVCTADRCDPADGCVFLPVPDGTACSDDDACNGMETCGQGSCRPGTALTCDDGLFCNGEETCNPTAGCIGGQAPNCDDGIDCTLDGCDEFLDRCGNIPSTASCDDGLFCNGIEVCDPSSGCASGTPVRCDDGIDCTLDGCDEFRDSCGHIPSAATCDDGLFCNGVEVCDANQGCRPGAPVSCDDGIDCTVDTCDEAGDSCSRSPDDQVCDNGEFCDGEEVCIAGEGCATGSPPDCSDSIDCTVDTCDEINDSCLRTADSDACNNGVFCDGVETCELGSGCTAGSPPDCDDGIDCTFDSCDGNVDACTSLPLDPFCDDGDACNGAETCDAQNDCQAGTAPICDDLNVCTIDICDRATGCISTPAADGTSCDDGDVCNGIATCQAASCTPGTALECDDASPCTEDACVPATGCLNAPVPDGTACDDADLCNGQETCQAGACSPGVEVACDDGRFCNGAESCNPLSGCVTGPPPDCADGIACTDDLCSDSENACTNIPRDSACSDGVFCNGAERCDTVSGCIAGAPPDCDDRVSCTGDICDSALDACTNTPDDSACIDADLCNGEEFCESTLGCRSGTPLDCDDDKACTIDTCAALTGCSNLLSSANPTCDDGNPCTVDECDGNGGCNYTAVPNGTSCADSDLCNGTETCQAGICASGPPLACDNGQFCDGVETCDPARGCVNGTPPCRDGVSCTLDSCNEAGDICVYTPDDLACIDGLLCNGLESCDPVNDCVSGPPPTCDDSIGCTEDVCDTASDSCSHLPRAEQCSDDDACNGIESCDVESGCVAGSALDCDDNNPCTVDSCDALGGCIHTPATEPTPCDDGNACTEVDLCSAGECIGSQPIDCDDGAFCNGAETCNPETGCEAAAPVDCSDGVACTSDRCNEESDTCSSTPDDSACTDDLFCDGVETCDVLAGCVAGERVVCDDGIACTTDTCNEAREACDFVATDARCDDGNACNGSETCDTATGCESGLPLDCTDDNECTIDSCNSQSGCVQTARDDGASCEDGDLCNGAETCVTGTCTPGTPPDCDDANACTTDTCELDGTCANQPVADGLPCEDADACNGAESCIAGECAAGTPLVCDDGRYCNGTESCDTAIGCVAGVEPCDDGFACTVDRCIEASDSCSFVPEDTVCNDGAFCNGVETCDAASGCVPGESPEVDDSIACTLDLCDEGLDAIIHTPRDVECDDSAFCNGAEICDPGAGCIAGAAPDPDDGVNCTDDSCDEEADVIVNVPNDGNCDDTLFCNGAELCDPFDDCQAGSAPEIDDGVPCTDDSCDEVADAIVNIENDANCDDGLFCNGNETCDRVSDCQEGVAPNLDDSIACTDDSCDEEADVIVNTPNDSTCDDGQYCNGGETCDAIADCRAGIAPNLDDGIECTEDSCDEVSDAVVHTPVDALCEDGNSCTHDVCVAATGCDYTNNTDACDDTDPCTLDDVCTEGVCSGLPVPCETAGAFGLEAGTTVTTDSEQDGATADDPVETTVTSPVGGDIFITERTLPSGSIDLEISAPANTASAPLTIVYLLDASLGVPPAVQFRKDNVPVDACNGDAGTAAPDPCVAARLLLPDGDLEVTILSSTASTWTFGNVDDCVDSDSLAQRIDGTSCDDGNACTHLDVCIAGECVGTPVDCSDGLYCTGEETCDPASGCVQGIPIAVDDGVACTVDSCDEANDRTLHVADDTRCDDDLFCNGNETCDTALDCQPGIAPALDDTVACTADRCDESIDRILHEPDDTRCDDGLFCNGSETCDATLDCRAGTPPVSDDGVACTMDICDESADVIINEPNDAYCDDTLYCNGAEYCDPLHDCRPGTPPIIDDGVGCTADSCDEAADTIRHIPDDSVCTNAFFCDGDEFCDPTLDCQAALRDCSDAVACTVDSCDESLDRCAHYPDNRYCDNGNACDGEESCSTDTGCVAGAPPNCNDSEPCTDDRCDPGLGCIFTANTNPCDDGIACTRDDTCYAGTCIGSTTCTASQRCDALSGVCMAYNDRDRDGLNDEADPCPDDARNRCAGDVAVDRSTGLEIRLNAGISHYSCAGPRTDCNGDLWNEDFGYNRVGQAGICSLAGGADCTITGIEPVWGCASEATEDLFECEHWIGDDSPLSYAFNVENGYYLVNLFFANIYAGTSLPGDRVFAIVVEGLTAYDAFDQVAASGGSGIAVVRSALAEVSDGTLDIELRKLRENPALKAIEVLRIGECIEDYECDDGNRCNGAEVCSAGVCTPGTALSCDDGDACNGVEICHPAIGCLTGIAVHCDDAVGCTIDRCDPQTGSCTYEPDDTFCDNGQPCDGAEFCDNTLDCRPGTTPDCDDANPCTDDFCDALAGCTHAANHALCDDGDPCTEQDTCAVGTCVGGPAPDCDDGDACTSDICVTGTGCTSTAVGCDDSNPCTSDHCDSLTGCIYTELPDGTGCEDGDPCNGAEACAAGSCRSDAPLECDDAVYCNGVETCESGVGCVAGTAVNCDDGVDCTREHCDEDTDSCVRTMDHSACDNGLSCDGIELCDLLSGCVPGTPADCNDGIDCTTDLCDETDGCISIPEHTACDDLDACNGVETCDAIHGCMAGSAVTCDDGVDCTLDSCFPRTGDCIHQPACPAEELCSIETGQCEPDDPRVCFAAATWPDRTLFGAMTISTEYSRGDDEDPLADSLIGLSTFADSASSAYTGGSGDMATYTVVLPQAAEWHVWARVYYPGEPGSNQANSFLISIDDGAPKTLGNNRDYFRKWHWDGDGSIEFGPVAPLSLGHLEAGAHRISVEKREVAPIAPRIEVLCLTPGDSPAPSDAEALWLLGVSATTTTLPGLTTTTTTLPAYCVQDSDCDDGIFCNGSERCSAMTGCVPGLPPDCSDGIACTFDACNDLLATCTHAPVDTACQDGDACNGEELCTDTGCVLGTALHCDDGNPCTDDACDPVTGCFRTANAAPCSDGIACTVDYCHDGGCVGYDSCGAGTACNLDTGSCDLPPEPRMYFAAATTQGVVFQGAMTPSPEYAGGDDFDPDADSITPLLVFPDSDSSAYKGDSADTASYLVDLPQEGDWYAWARVYYPGTPGSNEANSFFLQVDGGALLKLGNNRDYFQIWHWDGDGELEHGPPAALALGHLGAGIHEIVIGKREVAPIPPRLDVIFLTTDPVAIPSDFAAEYALQ